MKNHQINISLKNCEIIWRYQKTRTQQSTVKRNNKLNSETWWRLRATYVYIWNILENAKQDDNKKLSWKMRTELSLFAFRMMGNAGFHFIANFWWIAHRLQSMIILFHSKPVFCYGKTIDSIRGRSARDPGKSVCKTDSLNSTAPFQILKCLSENVIFPFDLLPRLR